MARVHGRAGRTLRRRLLLQSGVVAIFAVSTWWLLRLTPLPSWLALVIAGGLVLDLFRDRTVQDGFRRVGRGYRGERTVGRVLEQLPTGWRVFHDVDLGGENADHVVIGPGGAFAVEAKNYSAPVTATPKGLFVGSRRNDRIVKQAWRASHKLRELLGVEVSPVLVFTGSIDGDRAGRLPVLSPDQLPQFLRSRPVSLSLEEARRAWSLLEARVR